MNHIVTAFVLLCIIFSATSTDINWSTLTADQLSELAPSVFTTVSDMDLKSLQASTCAGFRAEQISALDGFSCVGFQSGCFRNMQPNVFNGFSSICANHWDPNEMQVFTADQLANILPEAIHGLRKIQLSRFTQSTCSGFTVLQLKAVDEYACPGFKANCLAHISPHSIPGFTKQCVKRLSPNEVYGLSARQISNLALDAFQGWTSDQLSSLNSSSCSGFSDAQVQEFDPYSCPGIRATCFQYMADQAIAGFKPECAMKFTDDSLSLISADQLSRFNPVTVSKFQPSVMKGIEGTACRGFSGDQIANLNDYGCGSLSSECFKNIDAPHFAKFDPICLVNLVFGSFSSISSAQMASLTPLEISFIKNEVWAGVNPPSCAGLTADKVAEINFGCSSLSTACFAYISANSFTGITEICMTLVTTELVLTFTDLQLGNLTSSAVSRLSSATIVQLINQRKVEFVDIWSLNQISSSSNEVVLTVKLEILQKMVPEKQATSEKLTTTTWLQMAYTTVESAVKVLNRTSITRMKPNGIRGIQGNVLEKLPNDIFADLTTPQIAAVFPDALSAISSEKLVYIPDEGFGAAGIGAWFRYLPATILKSLRDEQLIHAMPNFYSKSSITCDQFKAFTEHQHELIRDKDKDLEETLHMRCDGPIPKPSESETKTTFSVKYILIGVGIAVGALLVFGVAASVIAFVVVKRTKNSYTSI